MLASPYIPPDPGASSEADWKVKYAALLLEHRKVEMAAAFRIPPILQSVVSAHLIGSTRLRAVSRQIKLCQLLQNMESSQGINARWSLEGPEFESAVKELCKHEMQERQHSIQRLVQEYMVIEIQFERLATVRKDTKRLQKVKNAQLKKIKKVLQEWAGWKAAQSEVTEQSMDAALLTITDTLVKDCTQGNYPWDDNDNTGQATCQQCFFSDSVSTSENECIKNLNKTSLQFTGGVEVKIKRSEI